MTGANLLYSQAGVGVSSIAYIKNLNRRFSSGTIFLLIILASAKLRSRLRDRELMEDVILRLVYLLRCPTEGKSHSLFKFYANHGDHRPSWAMRSNFHYSRHSSPSRASSSDLYFPHI